MSFTRGDETVDLESRWWRLEKERERKENEEIEKRWLDQVGDPQRVKFKVGSHKGLFHGFFKGVFNMGFKRGYLIWGIQYGAFQMVFVISR